MDRLLHRRRLHRGLGRSSEPLRDRGGAAGGVACGPWCATSPPTRREEVGAGAGSALRAAVVAARLVQAEPAFSSSSSFISPPSSGRMLPICLASSRMRAYASTISSL